MATWVEIPAPADLVLGPDDKHVTNGPVATLKLAGSSTDATHADQNGNGQTTGSLIVRPDGTIGTVSARRYVQSGQPLDMTVNGQTRRLQPLAASVEAGALQDADRTDGAYPVWSSTAGKLVAAKRPFRVITDPPYRADDTGATDATAVISSSLALPGTTYATPGAYKVTTITLSVSRARLVMAPGAELNFSAAASGTTCISAIGTQGTKVNLAASTTAGASVVKVADDAAIAAAGIVAGDRVRISDSKDYAPARVAGSKQGEQGIVMAVPPATALTAQLLAGATTATVSTTAGYPTTGTIVVEAEQITYTGKTATTFTGLGRGANGTTDATHASTTAVNPITGGYIYLRSPLAGGPYTTGDTATVQKLTPLEGLGVEGGAIRGGGVGLNHAAVVFERTHRAEVLHTKIEDCAQLGVSLKDSTGFLIDDLTCEDIPSSLGYGVTIGDASQDGKIVNSHFQNARHAFTAGGGLTNFGLPRRIEFSHNNVGDSGFNDPGGAGVAQGDSIDCHANAEDITISFNEVYDGASIGINIECARAKVIGNTIDRTVSHGINWQNGTPLPGHFICKANTVRNLGANGINITHQTTAGGAGVENTGIIVKGNIVDTPGAASTGITISGATSPTTQRAMNVVIGGNTIKNATSTTASLLLSIADGATVYGNTVHGVAGIRLSDCLNCSVSGPNIITSTGSSIAIFLTAACTDCMVGPGNIVRQATTGVSVSNDSTYNVIRGNNLRAATTKIVMGTGAGNLADNNLGVPKTETISVSQSITRTPGQSAETTVYTAALAVDRTVTLVAAGGDGAEFVIVRTAASTGAFNLNVGTGPLVALPTKAGCRVRYDGAAWALIEYWTLP